MIVEIAIAPKTWLGDAPRQLAALSIRAQTLEAGDAEAPGQSTSGSPPEQTITSIALDTEVRRARVWHTERAPLLARPWSSPPSPDRPSVSRWRWHVWKTGSRCCVRRWPRWTRCAAGSPPDRANSGQVAEAQRRAETALRVLGLLTDLLPDDTFLTSISLRSDRLTIEGRSAAATRLIALLAAEPRLKNLLFAAPVVRGENGTDVFTIQSGAGT